MKRLTHLLLSLLLITLPSCDKPTRKPIDVHSAHQKFLDIATEEYGLENIQLIPLDNTVWIYLPIDHAIVDYKATKSSMVDDTQASERFNVNFLETEFADDSFHIDYDISQITSYPKDMGYGSNYHERYAVKYQAIFSAISRAYYEAEGDVPQFFVINITDITRGLSVEFTFFLEDYRKQATGYLPHEEAMKRTLQDMSGNQNTIMDKEGKYLNPQEITMSEFLARQITNRINFKYGRSNFPPSDDMQHEILYQVYLTLSAYEFEDYASIELKNLRNENTVSVPKENLDNYKDMPLPEGGKIHTIKFF